MALIGTVSISQHPTLRVIFSDHCQRPPMLKSGCQTSLARSNSALLTEGGGGPPANVVLPLRKLCIWQSMQAGLRQLHARREAGAAKSGFTSPLSPRFKSEKYRVNHLDLLRPKFILQPSSLKTKRLLLNSHSCSPLSTTSCFECTCWFLIATQMLWNEYPNLLLSLIRAHALNCNIHGYRCWAHFLSTAIGPAVLG
jgi:hypothetical protein